MNRIGGWVPGRRPGLRGGRSMSFAPGCLPSVVASRLGAILDGCVDRTRLLRALHRRAARASRGAAALCRGKVATDPYPEVVEMAIEHHDRMAARNEEEARFYEAILG